MIYGDTSNSSSLGGLISRVLFPGLAPRALLRRAFGAPDYPGSKKYEALAGTATIQASPGAETRYASRLLLLGSGGIICFYGEYKFL
jgi:hypothetical protein